MGSEIASNKIILTKWVIEALEENHGTADILQIAKIIWKNHEIELKNSGDLFYSWQYDYRWADTHLRKKGILKSAKDSPRGIWEISDNI